MPFQSEKQRRYLHANHPEIAKRWERDYATGGISNHFRKKYSSGEGPGGIANHFKLKDGGNIRLQPHTATDLLAKKNPDGTRSKYQPPGGGETSLGSGAAHSGGASDRGPRDAPDRFGPTTETKTTTTSPKGDDDAREQYIATRTYPKQYKTVETHVPHTDKKVTTQIRDYYDPKGHQKRAPKNEKERHILDKIAWGIALYTGIAPILGMKVPAVVTTAGKVLGYRKNIDTALKYAQKVGLLDEKYTVNELFDKEIEKAKVRKSKMDEYESLPKGHPDRGALEIELQISKKPDNLGDDGGTPPISIPVATEEIAKATDEGAIDMFDAWSEIKRKQALRASLMQDEDQAKVGEWVGDQRLLVNSGGLANLFRVKNQ